jgi:hypothetical protein
MGKKKKNKKNKYEEDFSLTSDKHPVRPSLYSDDNDWEDKPWWERDHPRAESQPYVKPEPQFPVRTEPVFKKSAGGSGLLIVLVIILGGLGLMWWSSHDNQEIKPTPAPVHQVVPAPEVNDPDNSGHHLRWEQKRNPDGSKKYYWRDEDGKKHYWPKEK